MPVYQTLLSPTVAPVIDTGGAYASGDYVGTSILTLDAASFSPGGTGEIRAVYVYDLDKQNADFDFLFFNSLPGTVFTSMNNAAFDLDDTDIQKICGAVSVTTDSAFNDSGFAYAHTLSVPYTTDGNRRIYVAPIIRSAATYTVSTNLTFKFAAVLDI